LDKRNAPFYATKKQVLYKDEYDEKVRLPHPRPLSEGEWSGVGAVVRFCTTMKMVFNYILNVKFNFFQMTNQSKINAPEAFPQKGGTLCGLSGSGVALAGKHAQKQPYVAPSFLTTDVNIEPFCGTSVRIHGASNMGVTDWVDEGNTNVGSDIILQ
jgi:hypothetical protein